MMATTTFNQTQTQGHFVPLRASNVMLLTTFRKNGEGVGTPVGVNALTDDKVYFTTWSTTFKVKRLANNPHVTVAPSTRMGKPIGATVEGIARQLSDAEWEVVQGGKKPSLRRPRCLPLQPRADAQHVIQHRVPRSLGDWKTPETRRQERLRYRTTKHIPARRAVATAVNQG